MTRAILFDLDGTLVDTRAASWQLFQETNDAFKLGIDSREAFFRAFEGNFFDSLARMCPDRERATAAKAHFMERLRARYHPHLIPGMVDVVRALAPSCTLAVLSTNSIEAIRRILVGAGIATCFSHVFAGDVQPRKTDSIRRFLSDHRYAAHRECSPAYVDGDTDGRNLAAADVVLVTDTVGDVIEARQAGVRSIGVSWGMHTEQQLLDAGAERVALWPQELIAWLRDTDAAGTSCALSAGACAIPGSLAPPASSKSCAASAGVTTAAIDRACAAAVCTMPPPATACATCACAAPSSEGKGCTADCRAAPALPAAAVGQAAAWAEAARTRRERQLHLRQQRQSAPPTSTAALRPAAARGQPSPELMRALQRIVGREQTMTRIRAP